MKVIGINKEKEICLPNKEYINATEEKVQIWFTKCMVRMYITAELKAYWLYIKLVILKDAAFLFLVNCQCGQSW